MHRWEAVRQWLLGRHVQRARCGWGRDHGHPWRAFYTLSRVDEIIECMKRDEEQRRPCFASVNYMASRGEPVALEKLFLDFDSEESVERAWEDALKAYSALSEVCDPLIVASGRRGYHLYVWLPEPIQAPKPVLKAFLEEILAALNLPPLPTLDEKVVADPSRLSRTPYTIHEKTGKQCTPIDPRSRRPIDPRDFDITYLKPLPKDMVSEALRRASVPVPRASASSRSKRRSIRAMDLVLNPKLVDELLSKPQKLGAAELAALTKYYALTSSVSLEEAARIVAGKTGRSLEEVLGALEHEAP